MSELPEGTVTILFTDVEGSTALRTGRGDEAAHKILKDHEELVREQVREHAGHEVKGLGDGLMVAFGSARKAVNCAVAIQKSLERHSREHPGDHARVRIGLNSGEVTQDDGDLMGAAVNAAARIMAKADGGQILLAGVVKDLAGVVPEVTFVNRGRFRLKGFPDRWQLFEVLWQREQEAVAVPVVVERAAFVGRERERGEIERLMEEAQAGRGGLVMIGGEPGIGKTRLTEEVKALAASRGFRAVTGHCYETEGGAAYVPFAEILEELVAEVDADVLRDILGESAPEVARVVPQLRRTFPEIPAPLELPPEQERRYILNSIRDFIARGASVRPQLLVLDDLHWADEATLLLLQHISERLSEMAVLIVGTYRDVDLEVGRPLARTLEDFLRRRLAHRVSLRRLGADAVHDMLKALASGQEPPATLVDVIFRETEGNPFFVEEVFQHLNEEGRLFDAQGKWLAALEVSEADVPEGVKLVIGRRLERLTEDARRALAVAATIGRGFSFKLLEAAGEVDGDTLLDAIDAAERAHLISATSEGPEVRFIFNHELIRQTLLSSLSLPRRQRLHLKVADAMERVEPDAVTELAHHLYLAGEAADPSRTARYLGRAGDRAMAAAAFEDAARNFDLALAAVSEDSGKERAELLSKAGFAVESLGHWHRALDLWTQAMDAFESAGEGSSAGTLASRSAMHLGWAGQFQSGLEIGARGLTVIGDEVTSERARLLGICGLSFCAAGGWDAGSAMQREAIEVATRAGDDDVRLVCEAEWAITLWQYLEYAGCIEVGGAAARQLIERGLLWDAVNVMAFLPFCFWGLARLDELEASIAELSPLVARLSHHGAELMVGRTRLVQKLVTGDFAAVERYVDDDMRIAEENGLPWIRDSYDFKSSLAFAKGDWEAAADFAVAAGEYDFPWIGAAALLGQRAMALAYAGRADEARVAIARAADEMPVPGQPSGWGHWTMASFVAEASLALGDREAVAALGPVLDALTAPRFGQGRAFDGRISGSLAGVAAAAAGKRDAAAAHFAGARRFAGILGARGLADAEFFEGVGAEWLDEAAAARVHLEAAARAYTDLGMSRHAEMARARMGGLR